MGILANILITALAVFFSAWLLPGVSVKSFGTAIVVAIVLALLNATLKPIMQFLTLPISFFTLGLFLFVIDTLVILLTSALVSNFQVSNFWWALLFSIIVSLTSNVLTVLFKG